MRLAVVVHDLGQFFARNVHVVRPVVVAGGEDELARVVYALTSVKIGGVHDKLVVAAFHLQHRFVLADVELVVLGALSVILERFLARWLLVGAGKGNVADLQQLRRGEERHVAGIVEQRVDQTALVDVCYRETGPLGVNGAGKASRSGADDDHVEREAVQHCRRSALHHLLVRASTPGSFLPSRNSSDAPPPVEMCVILSATPAAFTAATLSPPPTMEMAAPLSATACAIFFVPLANASISKTPIGPFHTMVRARPISLANSSTDFGPMSSAIMSGGIALPSPMF